ncbi:hypothetical protein ACF09K_02060 [Streptomyces sp. NPDC014882]|uniref:hypothetical protein n=1 Tax=Streptomyces sp. NPDC014882 TaxID=3364927 RepID=UPI003701E2A2
MSERVTVVVAKVVPTASLPSVSELPTPPSPGSFPELPDAPSLPSLPALAPSARTLPVPELPILPVPDRPVPDPGPDSGTVDPAAPRPPYGPPRLVREAPTGPVAHGGGQVRAGRAVTGTPAPAERAPAGLPDGARAGASQPDGGTPRHGDAHAVTSHQRVPLPSAPGSAVRTDAAGTEDRYRDIPVFPG